MIRAQISGEQKHQLRLMLKKMKTGILLFNLGGPENLDEVKPFLSSLFSDPGILSIPNDAVRKMVARSIATLRTRQSQRYYRITGDCLQNA